MGVVHGDCYVIQNNKENFSVIEEILEDYEGIELFVTVNGLFDDKHPIPADFTGDTSWDEVYNALLDLYPEEAKAGKFIIVDNRIYFHD